MIPEILQPEGAQGVDPHRITATFYVLLRREVMEGNPLLDDGEQRLLAEHYPVMMSPERNPVPLVTEIYTQRRAPAVASILRHEAPRVLDAGCGYGSESFLFAALGGRLLGVDLSPEKVAIAHKRKAYWEELFDRPLDIEWESADLDTFRPQGEEFHLTWIASVLAAVGDQDALLRRIHAATRPGGELMITDMNLHNPLFLWKEWSRRRRGAELSSAFAEAADFAAMVRRRGRRGARYFPVPGEEAPFDDAQFFTPGTLARLMRSVGFRPGPPAFSGFVPPLPKGPDLSSLEGLLDRVPLVRRGAYFYRLTGVKQSAGDA